MPVYCVQKELLAPLKNVLQKTYLRPSPTGFFHTLIIYNPVHPRHVLERKFRV